MARESTLTPAGRRVEDCKPDLTTNRWHRPGEEEKAKAVSKGDELLQDAEAARRLYRTMVLIRRFEERTEEQYTRARIGGYCHLAIGEEAATVGAVDVLRDSDYLFASYRDHGTALAVGSPPAAVMAELFG